MSIFSFIRHHAVVTTVSALAIIIIAVIAGRAATSKAPTDIAPAAKTVSVVSAAAFRNGTSTVAVQGVVESRSQADLKSQISAPVSIVYASVGDTVYAGQAIVELQNADIRAQLESARASLTLARGQYGTSRQGAIDRIRDAYITGDNVLHTQVDPLIRSTSGSKAPVYTYLGISNDEYRLGERIRDNRLDLDNAFKSWKSAVDQLSASSSETVIHAAIIQSQQILSVIAAILNDAALVFNDAALDVPQAAGEIGAYQTIVTAARANVSGSISSLTAVEASLTGSQTAQGSAAEAGVAVAEAGVKNLEAQLAKTIIRSPIAGKIAALSLHTGEFAAPGQLIATVVGNEGGLQVKAFASSEDFSRITVGAPATIQGRVKGVVTGVAPSVTAATRKAEVSINIMNPLQSGLVVGDTVQASIEVKKPSAVAALGTLAAYVVPIQNVKIIPGAAFVLTVDADSKIKRNDVVLGQVRGDFVEVLSGMTDDMDIVSPVYELEEGQTVTIQ